MENILFTLVLLVISTLICQFHGFKVVKNSQHNKKQRYHSHAQFDKIHKYLQRRYSLAHQNGTSDDKHSYYTNSWAVHVFPPEKIIADRIAEKHGFINIGPVRVLKSRPCHAWLNVFGVIVNA